MNQSINQSKSFHGFPSESYLQSHPHTSCTPMIYMYVPYAMALRRIKKYNVQVIDVKTKGILRSFREHKAPTRAVRWSCDGLRLASASDDKTLRLWDLPTSTALQVRKKKTTLAAVFGGLCCDAGVDVGVECMCWHSVRCKRPLYDPFLCCFLLLCTRTNGRTL